VAQGGHKGRPYKRRPTNHSGSNVPMAALAWAVLLVLITVVSVVIFWGHYWWFPVDISTHGAVMDHQFNLTLIICGIVFVGAQLGLALFVWKYRERGDGRKAIYSHGNNVLEA